jgi:SAM-dependent methyltransferase
MSDAAERHRQQIEAWNGPMGVQWAANEARTERSLAPVTEALHKGAAAQPGERVLDIGCGCGGSALAIAGVVGPKGYVLGADVSAPMIEVARATALPQTDYILADAAIHAFPPASFDLMISRFGVMFFGDPDAAFANLRRALKPGARVAMAAWRPMPENPWVLVPMQAVATVVSPGPRPGPEEPGPFAFGDTNRVSRILAAGGFAEPEIRAFDFEMMFPADSEAAAAAISTGPIGGRLLRDKPDDVRAAAVAAIAEAVAPCFSNGFTRLGASVWIVIARA